MIQTDDKCHEWRVCGHKGSGYRALFDEKALVPDGRRNQKDKIIRDPGAVLNVYTDNAAAAVIRQPGDTAVNFIITQKDTNCNTQSAEMPEIFGIMCDEYTKQPYSFRTAIRPDPVRSTPPGHMPTALPGCALFFVDKSGGLQHFS